MLNALNKYIVAILFSTTLVACGSSDDKISEAKELLIKVENAIKNKDFSQADNLLDSIDNNYHDIVDVRKEVIALRPIVIEGITINEIESHSQQMIDLQQKIDIIENDFVFIDNEAPLDGYYIAKELVDNDFYNKTGIRATVSEKGDFAMISLVKGNLGHSSISFIIDGNTANSDTIAFDNEINIRSSGTEMITYNMAQTARIYDLLKCCELNENIIVQFNGNKTKQITLSKEIANAIKRTFKYAQLKKDMIVAELHYAKLNQQLMVARDQIARTGTE